MILRLICSIGIVSGIVGELLPVDPTFRRDLNSGQWDDDLLNAPWNSVKPPRPAAGPPPLGSIACDMECIAEQLQAEIDALSKRLNELAEQMSSFPSASEMLKLYAQVQEVQAQMEGVYKRIDDLSSSIKEKLIQELEKVGKRIDELESELEDRIQQLEEYHDTTTSVLIRDALNQYKFDDAVRLYGALAYPPLVLHYIIEKAYQKREGGCQKLLDFIDLIPDNKRMHNAQALELLLNEVTNNGHIYGSRLPAPGSDCIFSLAARAQKMYRDGGVTSGTGHLDAIIRKLPGPVSRLLFKDQFFLRKEKTRCALSQGERKAYVSHYKLGDTAWTLSTGQEHPHLPPYHFKWLWFRLYEGRGGTFNTSFVLGAAGDLYDKPPVQGTNGVEYRWDRRRPPVYVVDERFDKKPHTTYWQPVLMTKDTISIVSIQYTDTGPNPIPYRGSQVWLDEQPCHIGAGWFPCEQYSFRFFGGEVDRVDMIAQFYVI